jgi:RNA polymerase sigma-70 factor (ECF subfamily)
MPDTLRAGSDAERTLLKAARTGDEDAFARLARRYRRELQLHCYRLLGSVHDAEDATQDTFVRAWRRLPEYEERAAFRAWLYRIATNVCLTSLARRRAGAVDQAGLMTPYPDRLLDELPEPAAGPEAQVETREAVELALLAAIQTLPPRQRAVLVLREVLGWSASEVATALETSTASVNSALQRARATIERERAAGRLPRAHRPASTRVERELLDRYVRAWSALDITALGALLAEDALVTMPPAPAIAGRAAITEFFATVPMDGRLDKIRLVETRANGQPALAAYTDDRGDGMLHAYGIMVFGIENDLIVSIAGFPGTEYFEAFGLPPVLAADEPGG